MSKRSSSQLTASGGTWAEVVAGSPSAVNLRVIQRHDAHVKALLNPDPVHVVLYEFDEEKKSWKRLNVEGLLFLLERDCDPIHQVLILNRQSLANFVQPVRKSFEFEIVEKYLIFRVGENEIYGIWFYDDAQREYFASLLEKTVMEASSGELHSGSLDALEQLDSALVPASGDVEDPTSSKTGAPEGVGDTQLSSAFHALFQTMAEQRSDRSVECAPVDTVEKKRKGGNSAVLRSPERVSSREQDVVHSQGPDRRDELLQAIFGSPDPGTAPQRSSPQLIEHSGVFSPLFASRQSSVVPRYSGGSLEVRSAPHPPSDAWVRLGRSAADGLKGRGEITRSNLSGTLKMLADDDAFVSFVYGEFMRTDQL